MAIEPTVRPRRVLTPAYAHGAGHLRLSATAPRPVVRGVRRLIDVGPRPVRGWIVHTAPTHRVVDRLRHDGLFSLDRAPRPAQPVFQLTGTHRDDGVPARVTDLNRNGNPARLVRRAASRGEPCRELLIADCQPILFAAGQLQRDILPVMRLMM